MQVTNKKKEEKIKIAHKFFPQRDYVTLHKLTSLEALEACAIV